MTKQIQKWADVAMFRAAPIDSTEGPQVQLLSCNNDPLGTIAAAAKMYKGEYVENLSHITDEERRHYLVDVRKNVLAAPLEFVNFHFLISGVTRGFTHQMVRQRTATYCQESTRFAVKEDVPVGIPPSLIDTMPWGSWWLKCAGELFPAADGVVSNDEQVRLVDDHAARQATPQQLWRRIWDGAVDNIGEVYNELINSGMPAEDARGILPTNLLTRINYNTSLRGLCEHSGLRLCTQAQFEWKIVWRQILLAIRKYGMTQHYFRPVPEELHLKRPLDIRNWHQEQNSAWQFDELASIFKPICYKTGKCEFMSDGDRYCAIRDRVQANAKHGIPSTDWREDHAVDIAPIGEPIRIEGIRGIRDEEWMENQEAARISQ